MWDCFLCDVNKGSGVFLLFFEIIKRKLRNIRDEPGMRLTVLWTFFPLIVCLFTLLRTKYICTRLIYIVWRHLEDLINLHCMYVGMQFYHLKHKINKNAIDFFLRVLHEKKKKKREHTREKCNETNLSFQSCTIFSNTCPHLTSVQYSINIFFLGSNNGLPWSHWTTLS